MTTFRNSTGWNEKNAMLTTNNVRFSNVTFDELQELIQTSPIKTFAITLLKWLTCNN